MRQTVILRKICVCKFQCLVVKSRMRNIILKGKINIVATIQCFFQKKVKNVDNKKGLC